LKYNGVGFSSLEVQFTGIYEDTKFWKNNLFDVPPGAQSKKFIGIMNYWLDQYVKDSPWANVALKVFMVLPNLILQKPSKNSKTRQHIQLMRERLELWELGEFDKIIRDCNAIQKKMVKSIKQDDCNFEKLFVRFMLLGKLNSAIRLLDSDSCKGVLPMTKTNLDLLIDKHPRGAPALKGTLLYGPLYDIPKSFYDNIDEIMIEKAIARTHGAAGPSNMDGHFFRQICSRRYREEGSVMKQNIAALARKLASEPVDPYKLEAFTTSRLIPLNKDPGVRPIGIGETLRRIVGKAISWHIKTEVTDAAGPLQVAAGLKSGAEAACHAMRQMFEEEGTDAIILVDATNAFNVMNRTVALHNVRIICPEAANYLINIYRLPTKMVIKDDHNSREIESQEGTTQGCNLGMIFYSLGMTPIVRTLHQLIQSLKLELRQCWLADDAAAAGTLESLKRWWEHIVHRGESYGYKVNESKTFLILKSQELLDRAKHIFGDTKIKFTLEGKRHLGACVGSVKFRDEYCSEKVANWCKELTKLCNIARSDPQVAYSAYVHSFQHKFTYFFRTIPEFEKYVKPLDDMITYCFLPTLFGSALTDTERELVALPTRMGGMGINILSTKAVRDFNTSSRVTASHVDKIKEQGIDAPTNNKECLDLVKSENEEMFKQSIEEVKRKLPLQVKRCVEMAAERGSSLPLKKQGFVLNRSEFMDALNLRYHRELRSLPTMCPCSQKFDITHALNCKKGGFVHMRHDNIRDFLIALLQKTQKDVQKEPPLQPMQSVQTEAGNTADEARLDIRARGFWRQGQNAYFDVRVTNPLSASSMNLPLSKVYDRHEKEKKRMYNHRIQTVEQGTFTPLVFSVLGNMGPECQVFIKNLCTKIAGKCNENYGDIMNWVRCKISFICLKACLMCLRGTRATYSKDNQYVSDDFGLDTNEASIRGSN